LNVGSRAYFAGDDLRRHHPELRTLDRPPRRGAWVFAAGTIGRSLGLDDFGLRGAADAPLQQTTRNILDRFVAAAPVGSGGNDAVRP
jgi:F420-0:gamma-glutamyl ligase